MLMTLFLWSLGLALAALAWWSRPAWLLWLEQPRLTRRERRRRLLRTATQNARDLLVAGYARDAWWWARRARCIDRQDPEALAAMAAVHSYKGRYEAAAKHYRFALHRARESGLVTIHSETWSHEALEHATVLLILADEDLPRRDALRSEAHEWLQFALDHDEDCRTDLNPRLERLARAEWVMP